MPLSTFEKYRTALHGQPLSGIWQGYGSTIFLEFGQLHPQRLRRGVPGNPQGEYTIMIEWSWRIENEDAILCGSSSDEENWEGVFRSLIGREVREISIFGRLPELSIALAGGIHVVSFMTADGQPMWTIFDQTGSRDRPETLSVQSGRIVEGV